MVWARPVQGFYRALRTRVEAVLIGILLIVPWVELGGEPLLRFDIPNRRFHVAGLVIFPSEFLFLWLLVVGLALALFFFTALAGRLWCGWGCPQTIFSELFAAVARRIQGWRGSRPPARVTRARLLATHAVWLALAALIGFHLLGVFVPPRELASALARGSATGTQLGFLAAATGIAYLDFAWVRQTFCKYLCPYARFQSVLFDRDTLVVAYDPARGEPRGKRGSTTGDCVDCRLCVAVCPTGIDIRQGLQLECIACTQCIDACDGVMAKLGREPALIGYRAASGGRARLLRPRVAVYGVALCATICVLAVQLAARIPFEVFATHNASSLYSTLSDGRTANSYTLHIENRDRAAHRFELGLEAPPGFDLLAGVNPIELEPLASRELRVFVAGPPDGNATAAREIWFSLADADRAALRLRRRATFLSTGASPPAEHTRDDAR
ncbi:MAG TPA: cytochrome c oxidase accessory protein CcoG [Myxococcota bacterium]|nr:cytochrome c oxidase accessory protein CcoG [Myxococcota bacterium]